MVETIVFNGVKFRRYPNSKNRTDRVYYTPGVADKKRCIRRLHEEIWMAHNGKPIPAGHHIHHIDGNPLNNEPANLEALPRDEHMRHHNDGHCTPARREALDRIRPLAAAWHSSPEGIEWHRHHAAESLRNVVATEHKCEQCGDTYETFPRTGRSAPRFCSNNCKSQWRRLSGLDDVERACAICAAAFTTNRYKPKKTCSAACAGKLSGSVRTSRPSAL